MENKVSILFVHKFGIFGKLVSLPFLTAINHVAIRVSTSDGDFVYEMVVEKVNGKWFDTMTKVPYVEYLQKNMVMEYPLDVDAETSLKFHEYNWDRRYDYKASFTWIFRKFFYKEDSLKWNCVEHGTQFLRKMDFASFMGYLHPRILHKQFLIEYSKRNK